MADHDDEDSNDQNGRTTRLYIPHTPPGTPPPEIHPEKKSHLSFGVVCSSNINRSMEAHLVLSKKAPVFHENINFFVLKNTSQLKCLTLLTPINTDNAGLTVESYGTGTTVRLPGRSAMEPRVFKFGTPYAKMYESLSATPEDEAFFLRNGVLQLCRRGAAVKVTYYHRERVIILSFSFLKLCFTSLLLLVCSSLLILNNRKHRKDGKIQARN